VAAQVITVSAGRNATTSVPVLWPRWWEVALLVAIGVLLLFGLVAYYDNVHRATTNGLWKSIDVAMWAEGSPDRSTDGGNLLYYPAIGAAVRALPGPVFGTIWQRMAYVNAIAGAFTLALTYVIALRLFGSRSAALFTVFFQASTAFFLLLSTINEDVMPAFFWFEAAFAYAILPRRWTTAMTLVLAQLVALTWLFHSSFQLPAIAVFALGLLVRQQTLATGVRRVIIFVASTTPLPLLAALVYHGDDTWWMGLWSGKGLGTGWGGFSAAKIILLLSGVHESVVGGANVATLGDILRTPHVLWIAATWVGMLLAFIVLVVEARRHWSRPEWRFAAVGFVGTFVLAEGMNLYIQPQDPQMQLQPMVWLPFAAGALFWITGRHAAAWVRVSARAVMVAAVIVLLVGNVTAYSPSRHEDSIALANIKMVESFTRPAQTMFVVHGFESLATWLTATWGEGAVWPNDERPQPQEHVPRFHGIYIASEATVFPSRSPQDAANDVVRLVSRALDEGFTVVSTDIWVADEAAWIASFVTVSGPEKPKAIRAALQENFDGVAVGKAGNWGTLYQLTRKAK